MLIYQVIIAVLVAFLYLILVAQSGKIKILKESHIKIRTDYEKVFEELLKRINKNDSRYQNLEQDVFVMVDCDSINKFQERVPIKDILGAVMSEMGLTIKSKRLNIIKEKGDSNYGKERTKTKRKQSKEKES